MIVLLKYFSLTSLLLIVISCGKSDKDSLMIHSFPSEIEQSDIYQLEVNGSKVPVEKLRANMDLKELPEWFLSRSYTKVQQEVHIADFSVKGDMKIKVHVEVPFDEVHIKPASRNIQTAIEGQEISFELSEPDKLYIQIDSLPEFCFFANSLPIDIPKQEDTGLTYFGPGIHKTGFIQLVNDQQIYLAPGAYVYGGIRGDSVHNIRVFGRGVLDGGYMHRSMVKIESSQNISFEGITIRNGNGWTNTLVNCDSVTYQGVKVISFGPSGDGINPLGSRNFNIEGCFLRCTDDCIAIKSPDTTLVSENIEVFDNTMIGYAFSDGITIGFETNGPEIRNIHVKNCDILLARGGSRVDGHSAFSIICDGPSWIHDVVYEDVRVEAPVLKLFELNITEGDLYGDNPPGRISDIYLKNIQWSSERPIVIQGLDADHNIQNIVFKDCYIKDKHLTSIDPDLFQIGGFVEGIKFQ